MRSGAFGPHDARSDSPRAAEVAQHARASVREKQGCLVAILRHVPGGLSEDSELGMNDVSPSIGGDRRPAVRLWPPPRLEASLPGVQRCPDQRAGGGDRPDQDVSGELQQRASTVQWAFEVFGVLPGVCEELEQIGGCQSEVLDDRLVRGLDGLVGG